jgi:GTP1/Obg family GTP-binding protein
MTGDVVDKMVSGIDNASVIILLVTQRYMNKVNGSDANDNCREECKYATQRKSSTKMISVVMEPRMKDIRGNWSGLIKMELGNIL